MKYDIVHQGTVTEIIGNMIVVSVTAESACGSCKVKGLCGMSESAEKEISVYDKNAPDFRVGEPVVVGVGTAMGMKAVLWAYVAPLFLMLATLFATKEAGLAESVSGIATLCAAALYFVCLALFRKRMEREIVFKIVKS